LAQLAEGYYTMEKESKNLAKLMDDFWCDLFCHIVCYAAYAAIVAACLAGGTVTYGTLWVACYYLLTYRRWDYWGYFCDIVCYLQCGG